MKLSKNGVIMAGCVIFIFLFSIGAAVSRGQKNTRAASSHAVDILDNEPFLQARSRMIKQGWSPIRMHTKDGFIYDGAARRLADQKILEVESCSIDAGANCIFFYRRSGQCLRIDTVGEQVREMKVTRWTSECPSSEDVLKSK